MDIYTAFNYDSPFSLHRPLPNNKSVLIGGQAEELKLLFEKIYNISIVNPVMTAIVGSPGTGKTHFLWNLEDRTAKGKRNGLVLIYDLNDETPNTEEILRFIHSHESFRELAGLNNLVLNDTDEMGTIEIANEINYVVGEINKTNNGNFGMCIGVDVVDEHIRQVVGKKKLKRDKVIFDLVGTFRLILDVIPKVCIIFALTKDVYIEMMPLILSDQTLRRRFLIPNGINGEHVEFGRFTEEEAYTFISTSINHWAERNEITINLDDNQTWPFKKSAIKLAWRVAPTPGGLSYACYNSLQHKLNENKLNDKSVDNNNFIITEIEMAKSLKKERSYMPFTDEKTVWNEIDFLIQKENIDDKLLFFKEKGEKKTNGKIDIVFLKDAFRIFFEDINFISKSGYSDLIIECGIKNIGGKVGVNFIEGNNILKSSTAKILGDLKSSQVSGGLFICLVQDETLAIKVEGDDFERSFIDENSKQNYSPTIYFQMIPIDYAFTLVGLSSLEKEERKFYYSYLDKNLNFSVILKSLMFVKPAINLR